MKRIAAASLAAAALLFSSPAHAVTNENGDVLISQAAVNAGNITPGDTPGFPVTLSIPGTYRLATNLTVTTAVNGIEVRANEVTIEMGGRTLAGSGVGRNGIASFNRTTTVKDGIVRGFTNDGVRSIAQFLSVAGMVITANGRNGVFAEFGLGQTPAAVAFVSVIQSRVTANAIGIECGRNCRVENSIVSGNSGNGVDFGGYGGLALGNIVSDNGGTGITFNGPGGAGNNTLLLNPNQIAGSWLPLQPNACNPGCPPPP